MYNNILDIFVKNLNNKLPYMSKQEFEEYNNYSDKIKNYEDIIYNCFQDKNDYLLQTIEQYINTISAKNFILNTSYYKDGIRIGVKLISEIDKNIEF